MNASTLYMYPTYEQDDLHLMTFFCPFHAEVMEGAPLITQDSNQDISAVAILSSN